jgi:hypothetical protein
MMIKYLAEILLGISIGAFIISLFFLLYLVRKDMKSKYFRKPIIKRKKDHKFLNENPNGQ